MKAIVVDASMAAAWTLDDEKSSAGERILEEVRGEFPVTPPLFWYEYRNVLIMKLRRNRLRREQIPDLIQRTRAIEIEEIKVDDHEWLCELALQYDLSAYDATYLALALEVNGILATNDLRLARAALSAGIEIRTTLEEERLRQ